MSFSAVDHTHMAHALRLAERGRYTTKPNPVVGCVLAHGERTVGEGWHERAGEPHAEVHALRAAGTSARGATAYVTLEPCGRHGRTPPCADALIAAGVSRVVMATDDAFQREGEGVARLRAAGIRVDSGLLGDAAREINAGFFSRIERARPWVRVKMGASLDGRTALADGRSQWITGAEARADVMRWRARSSAIITGAGTVRLDNPRLTVRGENLPPFVPPLRVVLDPRLDTGADRHVLDESAPTLLVHARAAVPEPHHARVERIAVDGAAIGERAGQGNRLDLPTVLAELAARGCNELMVEAGATLAGAFVEHGLCDELLLYLAPRLLGSDARALLALPPLPELAHAHAWRWHDVRLIGSDLRLVLRPA